MEELKPLPNGGLCPVCNIHYNGGKSGIDHFNGKKHKSKLSFKKNEESSLCKSIYVSKLPEGILEMELNDHFSQYGPVSKTVIDKNAGFYAIVEFSEVSSCEKALLDNKHRLRDRNIKVSPRVLKNKGPKTFEMPDSNLDQYFEASIIELLSTMTTVKEQIFKLPNMVTLRSIDIEQRRRFSNQLEHIFSEFYPSCKVELYGSSVNGFGFLGCDMDITILLNVEQDLEFAPCTKPLTVHQIRHNQATLKELHSLDTTLTINFVKSVFARLVPDCTRILVIPSSRCPLVRFYHKTVGVLCDVSCNKKLGIPNTHLLKLYGRLDPRCRPILIALRYWAKMKGLLSGGVYFNSYTFTWMVIFYLQNVQPPVLPSLLAIQNPEESVIVEGWDVSFITDFDKLPKSSNRDCIVELFKNFFSFYLTFDYALNAICPRQGTPRSKLELKQEMIANKDFKLSPITIQDPQELCHNISTNVSSDSLMRFLELLEKSNDMCTHPDFLKRPGITLLISRDEDLFLKAPIKRSTATIDEVDSRFTVELTTEMYEALDLKDHDLEASTNALLTKACDTLVRIFNEGLLINCSVCSEQMKEGASDGERIAFPPSKRVKREGETLKPSSKFLMQLHCEGSYRTWMGRNRNKLGMKDYPLIEERIISEKICKDLNEKGDMVIVDFQVILSKLQLGNSFSLEMEIVPNVQSNQLIRCVIPFLTNYLVKTLQACLEYKEESL